MNRVLKLAGLVGLLTTTGAVVLADSAMLPQVVFRAATDSVSVDVAVRHQNKPITGLTSGDFELTDNGIRQSIDAVSVEAVPVDLTLVLDASSSTAAVIDRFKAEAQQIASMLHGHDRVRLVAISTAVTEVFPLTVAGERLPVGRLASEGATSLHDALLLSLARKPAPGHRQLIVAFSDGLDTASVVSPSALAAVADRSDSVLHVVLSGYPGALPPTARSLRAAAEATGGLLHDPGKFGDAVSAFRRLFEDFRQSYVLRYTLTGVERHGWHDIDVRVVAQERLRYSVRARRGYFGG
jgi:VWFA-related protein